MHFKKSKITQMVGSSVLAIAIAFAICAVMLLVQGINPLTTFQCIVKGAAGSKVNMLSSIAAAAPLATASLGVIISFRTGVYNIGIEGQLFIGALCAAIVGTNFEGMPAILHVSLSVLAGMLGGAAWAFIPAVMKIKKGFNEVITTVLMNYIGIYMVSYAVSGPLREEGSYVNQSAPILKSASMPRIIAGAELNYGIILVVIMLVAVMFILYKSDWGYKINIVGKNPIAAQTFGIRPNSVILASMLISGAFAGAAGSIEVLGNQGVLAENFAVGMGYNAISVALLGGLGVPGAVLSAIFMGALRNGGIMMQISLGISSTLINVLQAIIILTVLTFATVKIAFPTRKKGEEKHAGNVFNTGSI